MWMCNITILMLYMQVSHHVMAILQEHILQVIRSQSVCKQWYDSSPFFN